MKGCLCKKRYDSKEFAEKLIAKWKSKGTHLRTYECELCDGWHLTKDIKE
jgi:hypothetical protein